MVERSMMSALAFIILLGAWIASASAEPIVGSAPQKVEDAFVPHPPGYRAVAWVQGLEVPWSLVFLPDGRALVSERPGRIRLIRDGVLQEEPYAVLATVEGGKGLIGFVLELAVGGEGGLMGLALHPDFPEEPYLYAMHTYRGPDGVKNRVIRLEDRGDHGRFDKVIIENIPGGLNHNGGRIAFGPDGMLYVTTGETFEAQLAADLNSLGGKILRLTPEGQSSRGQSFSRLASVLVRASQSAGPGLAPGDRALVRLRAWPVRRVRASCPRRDQYD